MKILIFTGPTISKKEVLQHLDATVLAPAAQGEILTFLDRYRPHAMGIIDTAFPRSAWVSEIHYALRSGVMIYGAGAQGALRAVELQDFGMKGYGSVFQSFSSGELSDDAAILSQYDSREGIFVKSSESFVNVKATLQIAHNEGIIDTGTFTRLSRRAQELHWKERTWNHVLYPELFTNPDEYEKGCSWITRNQVDVQKQDAREMLVAIANDREQLQLRKYSPADRFGMLDQLYRRERKAERKEKAVPFYSIAHHAAVNHPKPLEINFHGMNRDIVVFFAERMELEPDKAELEYEWIIFKHERSLDDSGIESWCSDNDMTPENMEELIWKNALCRKMHQWMIMKRGMARSTGPFLDELRMRGEYPQYADSAAKIETSKEQFENSYKTDFSRLELEEMFAIRRRQKKSPLPWPEPYNQASRVLGIPRNELLCELRRETFHQECMSNDILDTLYREGDL